MAVIGTDIGRAEEELKSGRLIAIPTETVYGLAGNAFDPGAIAKVFEVKARPSFDPLIVHTASLERVKTLVDDIPGLAETLAEKFWPGPITLLLKKRSVIPDLATSGMDTVAVRIPRQPLTLELLERLDFPLVAPSANPFGYISPTTAAHVNDQLGDKIDYILDGGACEVGLESTIVGFDQDQRPIIYRFGGTSQEQIEQIAGKVKVMPHSSSNPKAPGMLKSHYAPRIPLTLGDIETSLQEVRNRDKVGIISFRSYFDTVPRENQVRLAPDGQLDTAAKQLFSALREMDTKDIDMILAEPVPAHGLGLAINDRLRRAAAK